jgi:hypothetical protein
MDKLFELEQNIMDAWHVVDDINTVYHRSDTLNEDQLMNILLGIKELYQLKFEKLFNSFEQYVSEQNGHKQESVWLMPEEIPPVKDPLDDPII